MTVLAMLLGAWRRHKAYWEVYDELASMDDRVLADMNLTRSEIEWVARTAAVKAA